MNKLHKNSIDSSNLKNELKVTAIKHLSKDSNKEKQALKLIQEGKVKQAEKIYRELIAKGTSNHNVYGNLAALCAMSGNRNEVVELLNKAIEIKPNFPEAYSNLGSVLKELGNLKAAISSFQQAIKLKHNYPEAHNNLGNALQKQDRIDDAIISYEKAIKLK